MYMTNWQEPVVLRLVQPQFVANQWRRFLYPILDARQGNQSPSQELPSPMPTPSTSRR